VAFVYAELLHLLLGKLGVAALGQSLWRFAQSEKRHAANQAGLDGRRKQSSVIAVSFSLRLCFLRLSQGAFRSQYKGGFFSFAVLK
jgi:hypothetical protein